MPGNGTVFSYRLVSPEAEPTHVLSYDPSFGINGDDPAERIHALAYPANPDVGCESCDGTENVLVWTTGGEGEMVIGECLDCLKRDARDPQRGQAYYLEVSRSHSGNPHARKQASQPKGKQDNAI
jgi:hypothetical protein